MAFWGNHVFHGNYDGFRVIDVSDRANPQEVSHARCAGDQGDIVVWENILVRSWNSPATDSSRCDGEAVPEGFEGLHVWDISNLKQPEMIASVELPCGSHTATGVPDPENNRLLIYNQGAGGPCYFMDIVSVPLDDPASPDLLWQEPLRGQDGCHDSGVILGDVNLMACASGHAANVFDIGDKRALARNPRVWSTAAAGTPRRSPGTAKCSFSAGSPAAVPSRSARRRIPQ